MQIDSDKLITDAIRDGMREAVKARFTNSYNNPLDSVISEAVKAGAGGLRELLADAVAVCVGDEAFRQAVREQVRSLLAKTLVHRFGGELEKQVNTLKSDPATRARITLAIEDIAAGKKA